MVIFTVVLSGKSPPEFKSFWFGPTAETVGANSIVRDAKHNIIAKKEAFKGLPAIVLLIRLG